MCGGERLEFGFGLAGGGAENEVGEPPQSGLPTRR